MNDQHDNEQQTTDQGHDASQDLLADLESLRAQRRSEENEAGANDEVRSRLDTLADAAGSGRPGRKSARSAVSNRGTIFEDFVASTSEEEDEENEDTSEDSAPASSSPSYGGGLFSAAETFVPPEPVQPAAPSAGLLFQAPQLDLAEPAPRRAPQRAPEEPEPAAPSAADDEDEATDASATDNEQESDEEDGPRRRRRGGRGRRGRREDSADDASEDESSNEAPQEPKRRARKESVEEESEDDNGQDDGGSRRRRRRRGRSQDDEKSDEVTGIKGSTRMEAKRQRRREGREAGRRRPVITEAEFLARRESVDRAMVVRQSEDRSEIAVLEDGVCVEHYLSESKANASLIGNVYLGKVQNVLPSMEAAFIDIGKGRNAVLYAGEVNWDAVGLEGQPRRIELALKPGDPVLVQVTKDPVGHKGARLTSQISLPGRFLVYVLGNSMTGISRKLPDTERARLKKILKEVVPEDSGVIVRTAAEGASETELTRDVQRLSKRWDSINKKANSSKVQAPQLLYGEPDLTIRIIRDVFNEDFSSLTIQGDDAWDTIHEYVESVAPDLLNRVQKFEDDEDVFDSFRVSEQIEKALNRKVNLPSGGSLVIDRTEAMTVVDVNTGRFTGSGGNLEETVTRNNLEAAEEVVRQLRLRDIGGIIVVDFIDMVLESNRDLVLRRLVECLGRDRTRHQVAEVTSLGLVQMTRKRIGTGLAESLSAAGEDLSGRGLMLPGTDTEPPKQFKNRKDRGSGRKPANTEEKKADKPDDKAQQASREAVAAIAKATLDQHEGEEAPTEAAAPVEQDEQASRSSKRRSRRSRRSQGGGESPASREESAPAEGQAPNAQEQERNEAKAPAEPAPLPEPEEGVFIVVPRSGTEVQKASENRPTRGRRGRGKAARAADTVSTADNTASSDNAAPSGVEAESAAAAKPAAEASGPAAPAAPEGAAAPLMIGLDAATKVQEAPASARAASPSRRKAAAKAPAEQESATPEAKESETPAPPVIMLGMTQD